MEDNENLFSFQDLKVWQKSIDFAEVVIRVKWIASLDE
jgi:hypothetical protein